MLLSQAIILAVVGGGMPSAVWGAAAGEIQRRQETASSGVPSPSSALPSLTTNDPSAASNTAASASVTTTTNAKSSSPPASSTPKPSSIPPTPLPSFPSTSASNSSAHAANKTDKLPLEPRLTPALGIAGVFLIAFGGIYALIGVKSKWVQIFLSCAFLASIATTALIDYVMNPPVSDAVQGGFFVAIFMTGAVFGGGALLFQEYTEGFGCLLGGFCFSMWLLTLRPGGLITSAGGKGAFIGILCLVTWALSWTSITRPYALIASTSFGGATAFTLGIDCFTRAGLKEFWFYIWNLNDNLFPLNANYPLTKGIRVEIAVIAIGAIIGVLSQMKLWKVIRSKQREERVLDEKDELQREAVEAALGRHLQRQNEREKSEWEKQYGDRLQSKRNTVLWQNAQLEKRYSAVSVVAVQPSAPSGTAESLEMNAFGPRRASAIYSSKSKRQSSVTVDVIEEVEENPDANASSEHQAPCSLEDGRDTEGKQSGESSESRGSHYAWNDRRGTDPRAGITTEASKLKRGSRQSLSSQIPKLTTPAESREHLVDGERSYSRASSAAATMDEDNEDLDLQSLEAITIENVQFDPETVTSSADESLGAATTEHAARSGLAEVPENQTKDELDDSEAAKSGDDIGGPHHPHSRVSQGSNLSVDSLTPTALAQIPSQLSNVILSYRTNEWAKHIATADDPVHDEPEQIDNPDKELPIQLAAPAACMPAKDVAIKVPPAEPLPPTVKAGGSGVGIVPDRSSSQRPLSDQQRLQSVGRPTLKAVSKRGSRNAFNSTSTTSLVATPIDENVPTEFNRATGASLRASGAPRLPHRSSSSSLGSTGVLRPYTSSGSARPYSGSSYDLSQTSRPLSQHAERPSRSSVTRLEGHNSHQPPRRDLRSDAEKRESLLAEWRLSHRRQSITNIGGDASAEQGRLQMKADKENQKLVEEHQRNAQVQKQLAMDQVMRRPEMQELHREAMRKMQASANQRLR